MAVSAHSTQVPGDRSQVRGEVGRGLVTRGRGLVGRQTTRCRQTRVVVSGDAEEACATPTGFSTRLSRVGSRVRASTS